MGLVQSIHSDLRARILSGEISGGERISANAVAGELGVSRTPVRDAMNLLSAEGLVRLIPNAGFVVREFSYKDLQETWEMRIAIEPLAAELAARRATYDRVADMGRLCRRMGELARAVRDREFKDEEANRALWRVDIAYHETIIDCADNRQMQRSLVDFRLLTHKVRYPSIPNVREIANTLLEHWRICRAIRARDGRRAAFWMRRHAECGMRRALRSFTELDGATGTASVSPN
jgi:DNA-binding GntR family transcriptional regulator